MAIGRVETFLSEFRDWASRRPDIQAVALVGSCAPGTATAASDVDLVLIADEPGVYIQNAAWASLFGTIVRQQVEAYGRLVALRVEYDDHLEVEYGLTDPTWVSIPLDEGTRTVIAGGMRVLFERGPLLSTLT